MTYDPKVVRPDYSSETGLQARRNAYRHAEGPNAPEMVFEAVAEVQPSRFLEVGCGPGELAARVQDDLGAQVVAVDSSERMVELARGRGVDARLGDVQELPFADGEFDCVVAAWMLYHVPDVARALGELARVLLPGGRLIAVTNGIDHLRELREFLGLPGERLTTFNSENGEELLRAHFEGVESRDAGGTVTFPDRDAVLAYVVPSAPLFEAVGEVPELEGSLVVRRRPMIFVAEKA
ncbi:MAG: class I SAM-dependent methyltransferase [Actinobacteria bacterium]|nr:class I SAM-dependent methyltransferase [Actinomycetota bacterium]